MRKLIFFILINILNLFSIKTYADELYGEPTQNAICSYNYGNTQVGGKDTSPFKDPYYFPATTLKVSPSLQPSDTVPFATIATPPFTRPVVVNCRVIRNEPSIGQTQHPEQDETISVDFNVLSLVPSDDKFYLTNIPGIEVKIFRNVSGVKVYWPAVTSRLYTVDSGSKAFGYRQGTQIEMAFYKRAEIHLQHDTKNIVLNPQPIANIAIDHYSLLPPENVLWRGLTELITIQSTPECTQSGSISVPYGTINPDMLNNTVVKNINFSITCKSDYDSYTPHAYIRTNDPTESDYIKVTDASSANNTMGIKITTSDGQPIKINDPNNPVSLPITKSNVAGEFKWKGILFGTGNGKPAVGDFQAQAEIVINID